MLQGVGVSEEWEEAAAHWPQQRADAGTRGRAAVQHQRTALFFIRDSYAARARADVNARDRATRIVRLYTAVCILYSLYAFYIYIYIVAIMEQVKIYEGEGDIVAAVQADSDGPEACRLCLKKSDQEIGHWGLFDEDLPSKLMAFAAVQVEENDGLPKVICTNCRSLVYMSYNFKCQVEKSDHDLRQALLMKQSTTQWSSDTIIKPNENSEVMLNCLQKNINACMTIQNVHNVNNQEQFIFEIANSCNVNQSCKKDNQFQPNNPIENTNVIENNNAITFIMQNPVSENECKNEIDIINFDAHYERRDELIVKNDIQMKVQSFQESSNPSDDEKPLILRTKRHKCNYCIKSFANLSLLEKHAVVHKKLEILYVCYLCNEEFTSIDNVESHALSTHSVNIEKKKIIEITKVKRITGSVKNYNENSNDQNNLSAESSQDKSNTGYTCKFCGREFTYYKYFADHIKFHTEYNDKSLHDLNKVPVKADTSHSVKVENVTFLANTVTNYSNSNKVNSQSITLPHNAQEEKCIAKEISHKDSMDESEDDDEDENLYDEDEDDGTQGEDDNIPATNIQCNQCGKLVATLRNLKRHLLMHSGLKYNCAICSKDFSRPDKLREHQQLKHKNEVFGKSDTDNDSSDDSNVLVNRKKDKCNRPYKCSMCPKAFAQPQSLSNHEERHKRARDVQKRYLCEVCSKCFAQSGSLVAHMRTHTGVKPYVCNVCSRAFTKSTYLQLHLRTHSGEKPYICQYCSRAFARANTLARHITMHTGEAKYQCQICSKSFRRLTSLNEHTYTHTGQRPYACKICSKRYNNAGSLYAHTKKCKMIHASANSTSYPISFHSTENDMILQSENNTAPQLLIFSEKNINETITENVIVNDPSTCQFMVANMHGQKPLLTNMLEPFTVQESDIYNINSKQFKTPYYALYPSM